jgi:hypothetical protein
MPPSVWRQSSSEKGAACEWHPARCGADPGLASGSNPSRHRLALRTGAVGECALPLVLGMRALDGNAPYAGRVGEGAHPEVLRVGGFLPLAEVAGRVVDGECALTLRERSHVFLVRSAHRAPPNLIAFRTIRFSHPPSRHHACPLDAERQAIESTLPRKPSADTSSARATPRVADWPSPKEPGSDKPCPERQSGRRRLLRTSPKVPDHGPCQQAHEDARQDRRPLRRSLANSTEEAVATVGRCGSTPTCSTSTTAEASGVEPRR